MLKKLSRGYKMRRLPKLSLTMVSLLLLNLTRANLKSAQASSEPCPRHAPFIFREGDTLSEVLWFLGTEPVYGKRGWIEKTIERNPELKQYRNRQIPPGTKVMIPIRKCPLQGGWSINGRGELEAPYHHRKRGVEVAKEQSQDPVPPEPSSAESNSGAKNPLPTATPNAVTSPTPAPFAPSTQGLGNLKEIFEKARQAEKEFLDNTKSSKEIVIE